jgi:hypothetical protein
MEFSLARMMRRLTLAHSFFFSKQATTIAAAAVVATAAAAVVTAAAVVAATDTKRLLNKSWILRESACTLRMAN